MHPSRHSREPMILLLIFCSFSFSSVVCYVCFSADGRYLATGCNRTTQIFDVQNDGEGLVRNTFYETAPNSISRKCYFR